MCKKILVILAAIIALNPQWNYGIETLEDGVLTVGVLNVGNIPEHSKDYFSRFAKEHNLELKLVETESFDGVWLLPAQDKLDISAHGITLFEKRRTPGATFTRPFAYVRRSLAIRPSDKHVLKSFSDFEGRVIAYSGKTTAEPYLRKHAPKSTSLLEISDYNQAIQMLKDREIDAISWGYFSFEPIETEEFYIIEIRDLEPGKLETLVFAVRDASKGTLEALNAFIEQNSFPLGDRSLLNH